MGLKDVLHKMRLVEMEEPAPSAAGSGAKAPPPRRGAAKSPEITLEDILNDLPPAPRIDERSLPAPAPGEAGDLTTDFAAIYKSAGVTEPAHGYSALKVLEILTSEDFSRLDARAKASALAGFLRMNPSGAVPIKDVVQDAIRRDQALDSFEDFLRKKIDARRAETERENAVLQQELDALMRKNRERMEANQLALATEERRYAEWQARKRIEERRLFDAVAPFVDPNPISLAAEAGSAKSGPAEK